MSLKLAAILAEAPKKKRDREQILALFPDIVYDDGRTKECYKDECDISKIMARFQVTGTISHVNQYQGVYADFSDYDFYAQSDKLDAGRKIFEDLPAEVRREFKQDPQAFFNFVNSDANKDDLLSKLPALAAPGDQLPKPKKASDEPTETVEKTPEESPE